MRPLFQHNPVVKVYHDLVQWSQNESNFEPGNFGFDMILAIRTFKRNSNLFPFGYQHDTAEAYATILECWNNINVIRNLFAIYTKDYSSCYSCTSGDQLVVSEACKRARHGDIKSANKVGSSSYHTLMKDQNISGKQIVESVNAYGRVQEKICPINCGSYYVNVRTHTDLPEILVIQITSTSETVASPSIWFEKTDVRESKRYQLVGQVVHNNLTRGKNYSTSGHYTVVVSRKKDNTTKFISIDDAKIKGRVAPGSSFGNRLLFYVQIY